MFEIILSRDFEIIVDSYRNIVTASLCSRYFVHDRTIGKESKALAASEYCHETSRTKLRRARMRQEK